MDLLSGYGSDASSDDESHGGTHAKQQSASSVLQASAQPAAVPSMPLVRTKTDQPKKAKQRRKLLALNAVLPPEIFERLTKRQLQGGENSSDSEREDKSGQAKGRQTASSSSSSKRTYTASLGLTSFLEELRSTKASETAPDDSSNVVTAGLSTSITDDKKPTHGAIHSNQRERLGFVFTSIATQTTSKKEFEDNVVDIHAADKSTSVSNDEAGGEVEIAKKEKGISAPLETPNWTRPSSFAAAPIPTKTPMVRMAPRVQAAPTSQACVTQQTTVSSSLPPQQQSYRYEDEALPDTIQPHALSSRQKRKEMERALRKGTLDQALAQQPGLQATALHQQVPSYHLDEYAHAQASAVQQKQDSITVKMYDPKEGTTVDTSEVSSRHRAKHQIHQLAHSAMTLEASRLTNHGRTTKGTSSRVDAKRKYGW